MLSKRQRYALKHINRVDRHCVGSHAQQRYSFSRWLCFKTQPSVAMFGVFSQSHLLSANSGSSAGTFAPPVCRFRGSMGRDYGRSLPEKPSPGQPIRCGAARVTNSRGVMIFVCFQ
jgi:hypothetical protein